MTKNQDPILNLIERYKEIKQKDGHEDEFFKYEAIQHFQDNWNIDADDFSSMVKIAIEKQINLMYSLAYGTILKLANKFPDKIRELFIFLFDDSKNLNERIKVFDKETDILFKTIDPKRNGFQDERTISVYLTFKYPEKYTFFKDSFYTKFCHLLNEKKARKGKKYSHYLELIQNFKEKYLVGDNELWQLSNATLPENVWKDENLNILAQDILYVTLDQNSLPNYWVFQCNPNQYDIYTEWQGLEKETWNVSAHKNEIKPGDKVILWVTGEKSGCYGLCKVTSKVKNNGGDYVVMDIDFNLVDAPILKDKLLSLPEFSDFKGGNQGTNFSATKEQYDKIMEMINSQTFFVSEDEQKLIHQIRSIQDEESIHFHFQMIDTFIEYYEIKKNDQRLVFSSVQKSDRLAVTVNQRYIFKTSKDSFRITLPANLLDDVSKEPEYINHEIFAEVPGIETPAIYVYFKRDRNIIEKYKNDWLKICKENLTYGIQSGYVKHDNPAYRKAIFDKAYRHKIFQIAFSNNEVKVKKKNSEPELIILNIPPNLILYGPPGTGKTYNTINLALEICGEEVPGKRKFAVQKFKKLMDEGQIVFTTFHQSMSYEDFVEGIKPVLVEDEENTEKTEMIYKNVDGIFKMISEKANEKEIIQENSLYKLSAKNQVYKVSLKSDNPSYNVKKECFEKDEIRIGWDDTGDLDNIFLRAQQNEVFEKLGKNDKNSIKYFYELKQGDVVLVFHDLKTIDGIGIVEDDSYYFNDDYPEFKHVRKVKWLSKFKPIRIFELNNETNLTLPTVYRLSRISVEDITKLIQEKEIIKSEQIEKNEKNYVLIIDEINRGNISKIFGELITLIETDKRQGGENELEVILPYSFRAAFK